MALQDITKKWRGKGTRTYILTIKDQSTCLSIVNSEYFVFDSHPSDKFGMPSENGKAVLVVRNLVRKESFVRAQLQILLEILKRARVQQSTTNSFLKIPPKPIPRRGRSLCFA